MGDRCGLSTEKALQRLRSIISEEVNTFVKSKEQSWLQFILNMLSSDYIPLSRFSLILLAFEITLLVIGLLASENFRLVSISFELILLILFSITLVVCCMREHHLKEHEMERLILSIAENIIYDPNNPWSYEHYPDIALPETNSISLIWTYRDGRIVNLPHNLLVEEDIIILGPSRVAPAECRQLTTAAPPFDCIYTVKLEPGDIFNPAIDNSNNHSSYLPYPRQKFEVTQAPVKSMIRSYLASSEKKKTSILNKHINVVMSIFDTYIIWIIFLCSLMVNVLRWQLIPEDVGEYWEMLILIQVYTILPLLPLVYPFLCISITLYGTARLRILFHMYCKRCFDPTESEEISLDHVNCPKVLAFFWKMVVGHPQGLPRTVNLLHTLGSITRYCCVDKEGILCHPSPVPEKVFFFRNRQRLKHSYELENLLQESQEFSSKVDDKEPDPNGMTSGHVSNDIEVLNISPDPKSPYGIQFDDIDWEELLSSLKPLGINMLFNSPCQHPIKSLQVEDFSRHLSLAGNQSVVSNFRGCLCSMAKQIGFEDRILSMFKNKQQLMTYRPVYVAEDKTSSNFYLSIVKEKHVPMIIASAINEGKRGVSQLLAQGSADLVLEACSEFWNGDEICALTDTEKKKALSFFQRMSITRKCVAFSYRPIFQEDFEPEDIFFEYPSIVERKPSNDTKTERKTSRKFSSWMKKGRADIQCEEILQNVQLPPEDISIPLENMQKQIFLGMVTLTHSLKEGVVLMVEQLNNAGIRFVHFSYDNELRSRVFCQRLGLETGWNCHISLQESHGTTNYDDNSSTSESMQQIHDEESELFVREHGKSIGNDSYNQARNDADEDGESTSLLQHHYNNFDELYFMSNRSKLPKGIQSMRAHLERVDDVPLLVPLFTDCNSDAVAEMMNIMQEYGEIVCCTGSVLNANNYRIFSRSDISIALEPIFHQTCFLKQGQQLHNSKMRKHVSVSDPDICESVSKNGPLSLSATLNSLPCSLSCQRKDNFPIAALLCEARRLVTNCESCFLFLLSCQLSLSMLMLFSSLMMLPPPLTGIHLLWLVSVIIPILSVSLIGTPASDDLMKTISGKCKKIHIVKGLIYPFMIQFVPTFLLNSAFIVICIFPWILHSFCSKVSKYECHWLLGARNVTAPWNGWYGSLKGGLFFAQDILLFYITAVFIVLSASFVHRRYLLWQVLPSTNKPWCLCVFICFLLQLLHIVCSVYHWNDERLQLDLHFTDISHILYAVSIIWLLLLMAINEYRKKKYIRTNVRFQKRERLKFDTKLGMNSPV